MRSEYSQTSKSKGSSKGMFDFKGRVYGDKNSRVVYWIEFLNIIFKYIINFLKVILGLSSSLANKQIKWGNHHLIIL